MNDPPKKKRGRPKNKPGQTPQARMMDINRPGGSGGRYCMDNKKTLEDRATALEGRRFDPPLFL